MANRNKSQESYWRGILKQQTSSGLSIAAFCHQNSITQTKYYAWQRKLREQKSSPDRGSRSTKPSQTRRSTAKGTQLFNRRRNRLKVLYFTSDGTVILYKHLERGTFETLRGASNAGAIASPGDCLTLHVDDLRLLLEGIELSSIKRRKWWRPEQSKKITQSSSKSP